MTNLVMAYLDFKEFPNLIEYYTTISNGTLLKEEHTTIKNCTVLEYIDDFMKLTQLYFLDIPNQILKIFSTLTLWSKLSTLRLVNILPYMISWSSHPKKYLIGNTT